MLYMMIKDYYNIREAASYLGVSTATLRNWDKSKKLKARRNPINSYRLYNREDLDELLKLINES